MVTFKAVPVDKAPVSPTFNTLPMTAALLPEAVKLTKSPVSPVEVEVRLSPLPLVKALTSIFKKFPVVKEVDCKSSTPRVSTPSPIVVAVLFVKDKEAAVLEVSVTSSLPAGVIVPMPTLSVIVVNLTTVPSSVQPEAAAAVVAIVIDFPDVSGVRVISVPEINLRISVLVEAANVLPSTSIVLKVICVVAGEVFVIVDPEMEMPVPAVSEVSAELEIVVPEIEIEPDPVKVTAPVLPCKEVTPVAVEEIVGVWPPVIVMPVPAVRL